ncbi:MAG: hypothetical protein C7B45_07330 [Sulfobacillus acidophilus]|uniref:Asp23/Gls24 family envelope stress response protein n=1 Tax=Sulfobacillus acidophilus TaxID=53633 RepID=A0A2T2WJA5_9FIRM|nr:MAG: hypothetical protein C7B45_07330 [Sulfobacillus acidophilus]
MAPVIYALIGPSGSGKSHRASLVAVDKGVDTIIDDGLLIHHGRIEAGRSAKREATRMAAVKRAIFEDPDHRAEVIAGLKTINPDSILVLGTSEHMIDRILAALNLDAAPRHVIRIEEIASPDERRIAHYVRRTEGKHVIPAPTMEVRKSFSGYLVDPLRFIFRKKGLQVEVEKSIVRPTYSGLGRFYIADRVLSSMAVHAVGEIPEIDRVLRVMIQSTVDGIIIQLDVILKSPRHAFNTLRLVQQQVRQEIETMTSLNVLAVQVEARRMAWDE